jgi:hypothetical protein
VQRDCVLGRLLAEAEAALPVPVQGEFAGPRGALRTPKTEAGVLMGHS